MKRHGHHGFALEGSAIMLRRTLPLLVLSSIVVSIAAAAAGQDRAAQVLTDARRAIGNLNAVQAVSSISTKATVRRVMKEMNNIEMSGNLELEMVLPDKFRRTETISFGPISRTIVSGVNGDEMFYDDGGALAAAGISMSETQRQDAKKNLKLELIRWPVILLLGTGAKGSPVTFAYAGEAEAPDGKADVVDAKGPPDFNMRLFLEKQTHQLLMATYQLTAQVPTKADIDRATKVVQSNPSNAQQAMKDFMESIPRRTVTVQMQFSDFRKACGFSLPHRVVVETDGQGTEEWTVRSFAFNTPVKAERFRK
jgi:hypothetical protein